ncbi:hypothetical protein AVEN_111555-1 [Araneus ventricosus]|uniref:Uncharacterized protein n=1 Tax=Araneus ventricosus TaxID=182803 RepID=A0A4Y2M5T4_ARAVE|nr:hypothetical protein AVEN_111555-1 [Araneus ventricosus]
MLESCRRTLPELQPGISVFVQNRVRQWEPAEVLRQNEIPRSYRIRTHNGEIRRNTRPESTPTIRPQEPVDEPASDSQSGQESSSEEPISGSPDKGPYRTRYGRVVKPPSLYVAKF